MKPSTRRGRRSPPGCARTGCCRCSPTPPVDVLSEVSRLAPQLRARGDVPPPAPIGDESARFQFIESLAASLLYGAPPRLLVLDDVQWCDAPTLGLVAPLLHSRPSAPALVVAITRPEELDDDHPFLRVRDALAVDGRMTEVEVGRLSPEDTATVADAVASAPLDSSDHDRIWAESAGNPLFVVEFAKSKRAWTEPGHVAPTVRAVIEGRLRRLGVEAGAAWRKFAVALRRRVLLRGARYRCCRWRTG